VQLTAAIGSQQRQLEDRQTRWSGRADREHRAASQADSASSILVTRSEPEGPGQQRYPHLALGRSVRQACSEGRRYDDGMTGHAHRLGYLPLTVADLGKLMSGADQSGRWRLVAEFLEDYRHETTGTRFALLEEEPLGTGDARWDVFLAGLAEHLAEIDGRAAPPWADQRSLQQIWFPFNTRAARVDALVHAPAAFRRRGVYVAPEELKVA